MAVFDIHKIRPNIPGDFGCAYVVLDQLVQFGIGPYLIVSSNMKFPVKNRMAVSNLRFHPCLICWFAEPARMGELESDNQVFGDSVECFV